MAENELANLKSALSMMIGDKIMNREELAGMIAFNSKMLSFSPTEEEVDHLIAELEAARLWRMGEGISIVAEDHVAWLDERTSQIDWKRWDAYSNFVLSSGSMGVRVIDSMDKRNSKILDLTGDPSSPGNWARRGLVIGDVQSGKTANYLALFNKAADAGYKIFILLAGDKESLRRQTQGRVDKGFVGLDSKTRRTNKATQYGSAEVIGVGKSEKFRVAHSLTSFFEDFNYSKADQFLNLDGSDVPFVFVIKKNRTILKR